MEVKYAGKDFSNQDIARILNEMGDFYEMDDIAFKPRAYEKAALGVENLDEKVTDLYRDQGLRGLLQIPGVGRGIASHLLELMKTGKLKVYEKLKKKTPVNLSELGTLSGLGPKKILALYRELGIRDLQGLKKAVSSHKIRNLTGFGQKSEEQISASLDFRKSLGKRFSMGAVFRIAQTIVDELERSKLFERIEVAGSFRRRQETVGDLDILALSHKPKKAMEFFVGLPEVEAVLAAGNTKSEIRLKAGLQVDLRIVPRASWGSALQYFTGDKAHNIKLRKIALKKGLKLSEYGLFSNQESKIKTVSEEQVYRALGLDLIPPEMRTDSGEIEAAKLHKLPKLINYGDVKGDLQVQTNWTDGLGSIEEMAKAAMSLGLKYIAITDHTKALAVTGGLDEKKLIQQMKVIDSVNSKLIRLGGQKSKFRILKGAEVDILKDGSLDIAHKVLEKLDIVGVSIHSHFKMSRADMTSRIVRALSNPHVDIFFHPTTRIINRRAPIDFDFSKILEICKKNKVALEVNASPDRLDIHDTLIRQAVASGVKLVINTDAHNQKHLENTHFGEAQARRGWASASDVLNTKTADDLLEYFKRRNSEKS